MGQRAGGRRCATPWQAKPPALPCARSQKFHVSTSQFMKPKRLKEPKSSHTRAEDRAGPKARPEFWLWAIGLIVALFAAFQIYGPALYGPFLFDDAYLPMNVPAWANSSFLDSLRGLRPI